VYALIATLRVQPEHREAFLESMLDDARGSVNDEPGSYRFDVLVGAQDPNALYLGEVYRDRAVQADLLALHYVRWRDTVKDWYAPPGQSSSCAPIFPPDSAWTK
jgi:quinol monooxygenase YgiN